MKILAFSDWRIQLLEMIINVVVTHKPDVILYAGDDLDRFVRIDNSLLDKSLLKTPRHLIKLNYPDLESALSKQNKLLAQKFNKSIQERCSQSSDILQKLGIPFYYVDGNNDFIRYTDNTYYILIHSGHIFIYGKYYVITETPKGEITIKEMDNPPAIERGIYVPMTVSPSFGKFTIQKKSEEITVFGSKYGFGFKSKPKGYADIYLSHLPPLGTLDLSVRFGIEHIGSEKLLDAIKKYHPKLVICGHSHIWSGISRKIGDTLVINVSSQDRDPSYGKYVLIDTDDWSVEMKTVEEKTMRPIRGMRAIRRNLKRKRLDIIINKNSRDMVEDFAETLRNITPWEMGSSRICEELVDTLEKAEELGVNTKRVKERIESLTWNKPKILRKITINPNKHAFVDVETGLANGPEPGKLWLIGLWYNDLNQFLFPKEKKQFVKYLKQNQITSLVSWTRYDSNALRPVLERANIGVKFIDACQRTANCVIWYTYRLHELYSAFFPDKSDSNALIPGYIAGLYADHLIISGKSCPYCPPQEMIIEQIKERNKVDILQMIEICRRLWYD